MPDFDDAFNSALSRGSAGRAPMPLEETLGEFGESRAEQNRAAAERVGRSVSTIRRWRREGRVPKRGDLAKLRRSASQRRAHRQRQAARRRGVSMTIHGTVTVSADTRRRRIAGLSVSAEAMAEYLELHGEDPEQASDGLLAAIGEENGFGAPLELDELDELDVYVPGEEGEEE